MSNCFASSLLSIRAGGLRGRIGRRIAHGLSLACLVAVVQGPVSAQHVHGPGYKEHLEQTTELAVPCPVMPHKQANGKYRLLYEGRTYYFCCSDCIEEFKENPKQYIDAAGPATVSAELPLRERIWETLAEVISWNLVTLMGVACSLLIVLVGIIYWRVSKRVPTLIFHVAWLPLVVVLVELARQEHQQRRVVEERQAIDAAKEYFNYAVTHDFGNPPIPARPAIPPRLRGAWYRGNDERTSRLWNNGHYRTSSFDLRLERADGTPVAHGDKLAAGELHVQMDIIRAPFTTEEFWSPAVMNTIFLTRENSPVHYPGTGLDRVRLTTVEPRQRFTAGYPAGQVKGTGAERLRGMIYVCEEMAHRGIKGARYHLAIQYDITLQDGVVQPESDLWMGALYRTRRVSPWQLPLHEWFSHLPIPELPQANTTTDATALGTADYQHIIEEGKGTDGKAPADKHKH